MAIGATNKLDQNLVRLYAGRQTTTTDMKSLVEPKKVLDAMNMMAMQNRVLFNL